MNQWVQKLCELSSAPERTVLGVMSGTSMDGLDLALCRISGSSQHTRVELLHFEEVVPDSGLSRRCRELAFQQESRLGEIMQLGRRLGEEWANRIGDQLEQWEVAPDSVDLLASHGQTILHLPDRKGNMHTTCQLVDGDLLAMRLGIITVSDFRQKSIAAGGEGAPLVPFAESLLFGSPEEDRILLNLGGIANLTLLPAGRNPSEPLFATDTGPANTLIDEAVRRLNPGHRYDDRGRLARSGRIHQRLLEALNGHPFFSLPLPRSTGPEAFSWPWLQDEIDRAAPALPLADLLATLVEFTAMTVSKAIPREFIERNPVIFISGGGWENDYLVERTGRWLPGIRVESSQRLGIDTRAKEAILFAVLANEAVAGTGWPGRQGRPYTFGKISFT